MVRATASVSARSGNRLVERCRRPAAGRPSGRTRSMSPLRVRMRDSEHHACMRSTEMQCWPRVRGWRRPTSVSTSIQKFAGLVAAARFSSRRRFVGADAISPLEVGHEPDRRRSDEQAEQSIVRASRRGASDRCLGKRRVRVRMRVQARLHTLLSAAACCSVKTHGLQALSTRCSTLQLVWRDF